MLSNSYFQYRLNLPGYSFQGPLDLLLQLIERRELPITEISLARIADEYLVYIDQLNEVSPGELADFLVVAARLLQIKSTALLPPPLKNEELVEEEDSAERLLAQLLEYKRIKEAAGVLRQRFEAGFRAYPTRRSGLSEINLKQITAEIEKENRGPGNLLGGVKLSDLIALVRRRLAAQNVQQLKLPLPVTPVQMQALSRSIKIEDKIALLEEKLNSPEGRVTFTALFDPRREEAYSNLEIIVTFMGVLELLRHRQVQVEQHELFGEIFIEKIPAPGII